MKKLLAVIVAGMFAVTATAPVFAADKGEPKKEQKKGEGKKKAEPKKKGEGKKKADDKKKK